MSVPLSSTYNGWWDNRDDGTYDLYYRGTKLGQMNASAFTLTNSGAGLGYATGAGGSITQATNKTTAVTLNTLCGQITGNNASLSGGAEATYTVSNSTVALGDVVIPNVASGGTSGHYLAHVTSVAAGSFDITIANMSAVAADAVVVNFAVIKSVVS